MKFSKTVNKVIALAEAIRDYWDTELPKRHPDYPFVNPDEEDGPPPPEEKKLKAFLARLPEEDIYKLALIMDLGRGRIGTDDLAGPYQELKETLARRDWAIAQLMTPPTAAYLNEGLDQLRIAGIDVDHLPLTSVSSGS
jgi:hypothetical protein